MDAAPALPTGVQPGGRFADWAPAACRYVVCDVDGTLVGPSELATDRVVRAVAAAQAAGLRVGYATGRMRDAVAALHDQLGARGPHVLHNGGEVRADGATIAAWPLTVDQIDALLAIAGDHDDTYVEIYTESGFVASAHDERARPHWELLGAEPRALITRGSEVGDQMVPKATFAAFSPEIVDVLVERIAQVGLQPGPAGSPRTPDLGYVNATHPDADKGRALVRAAAHLGLRMAEVVAVGDAANDLSMLEVAGTAIAMGQADPEVVAAAHLVVPDVADDGAAVALELATSWRAALDQAS